MALVTMAVWLPARGRELVLRKRIDGFVDAGTARPGRLAQDLGGRRRRGRVPAPTEGAGGTLAGLERRLAKAQVPLTARELLGGIAIASLAAFSAVGIATGNPSLALVIAVAVPPLSILWLGWKAAAIRRRFAEQLADTVALLASSVRTGHSVQQALENVGREAPEPTRSAFALTVREVGLGASLEDALGRLIDRYPSEDIELVVTAINVHASIGGSLARILDVTADTIRERFRMAAEVKALTAQQRYSSYVLALLPVFTLVMLSVISPDYVEELFKPGSLRIALGVAGGLVLTGFLVMQKMGNVDA